MSEAQGGGALEPHNPYSFSKEANGHGHHITELTSSDGTTLTLLKSGANGSPTSSNSSGLPSLFTFGEGDGLGTRISDAFSEIRYAELTHWDLNLNSYSSEGLTARLIDNRSMDSADPYRPWEKPDPNSATPTHQSPTSTSNGGNPPLTPVSVHPAPTPTPENGISSTNNDKSPTTLTPLTNVFPNFSETFHGGQQGQQGQGQGQQLQSPKLALPSFQSQFSPFPPEQPAVPVSTPQPQENPPTSLPSFHTLPANRAVSVGVYTPQHAHPHPPQFLEERHIQIFPSQVQFVTAGQGQGQGLGGNLQGHLQGNGGGQHHHFNVNGGMGNGGFGGQGGTIQLQELVPVGVPHLVLTNGKGHHATDGINLNIIHHEGHHGHLGHAHPPPHLNITNMPKYIHGAGIVPGGQETHLIAVNPNMLHHQHPQPQLLQHAHNGHHIKLEQNQCSPNGNGMLNNNGIVTPNGTPKRQVNRKRKGLEHQGLLDPHSELDPQVSSVSSTDSDFHHQHRRPINGLNGNGNGNGMPLNGVNGHHQMGGQGGGQGQNGGGGQGQGQGLGPLTPHTHDMSDGGLDKPVKKKRKRCGECIGCQRKDNCGDCAPCRNDKSHQICKMRRCDKLTEKKTPKVKLKQQQH